MIVSEEVTNKLVLLQCFESEVVNIIEWFRVNHDLFITVIPSRKVGLYEVVCYELPTKVFKRNVAYYQYDFSSPSLALKKGIEWTVEHFKR